jgi:hypothetical protein
MKKGRGILQVLAMLTAARSREEPAMDTMARMLFRKNENGGRMAFNSDFRKVHLWKMKKR